jgi:hypothetical protein
MNSGLKRISYTMPFTCQLTLPPHNGSPIAAKLESWRRQPFAILEQGDAIADITIEDMKHLLCASFPCGLSAIIPSVGDSIKTGDRVAVCIAEGEEISYGRDYLFIRAA